MGRDFAKQGKLDLSLDDVIRNEREALRSQPSAGLRDRSEGQKHAAKVAVILDTNGHGEGTQVLVARRIYVGNLSYKTSWQDLKDHFRQAGQVVYANVMKEGDGQSKGCGIVEFERADEAADAIKRLHDSTLTGRPIIVREDREDRDLPRGGLSGARGDGDGDAVRVGRRVYVGNLSWSTSWQDLKDHFRQIGTVVYSNVMEEDGGRSKGCGIVEFERPSQAARAIEELNGSKLKGRPITVREDREDRDLKNGSLSDRSVVVSSYTNGRTRKRSASPDRGGSDSVRVGRRVYVGNLAYATSWQDLKDHFRQVGTVVHAKLMEDRSGRSKGCGIVEFERTSEAAKAIKELHDSALHGRPVSVREDREDRDLHGGLDDELLPAKRRRSS